MQHLEERLTRNVTIPADARALAVDKPEIPLVMSKRTGALLDVRKFIEGRRYDRLIDGVRAVIADSIRAGTPRLICPICTIAVTLRASTQKRFFFRHETEDGSCPAVTRSLTNEQIRAMKYNGQRESEAHRKTKLAVAEGLECDPGFSDVMVEKAFRPLTGTQLRRPDVQAVLQGNLRIAFEIQLTTTFLDVVRGRRAFYLENGALLVWVLRRFDPYNRRMTEDDIVFTNNSNILVVDGETLDLSRRAKAFMVRVHYRVPYVAAGVRRETWKSEVVPFAKLTLDLERQRAFLFDFEEADRRIEAELKERHRQEVEELRRKEAEQRLKADQALREKVIALCVEVQTSVNWTVSEAEEFRERWGILAECVHDRGIPFPEMIDGDLCRAVAVFLSAKAGEPVGYRYKHLIEIVHMVDNSWKPGLIPLWGAIKQYGHENIVRAQDRTGKLESRFENIKQRWREVSLIYKAPIEHGYTLRWIFPDLKTVITC